MTPAQRLALEFSKVLREWLTPEEMKEVIKRNAARSREDHNVCHSHDFCDANMAMMDAFERCFGRGLDFHEDNYDTTGPDSPDMLLWGDAWTLAKASRFKT